MGYLYVLSGAVAMAMSVVLSGCKLPFGNHVEEAPNPDPYTGYYATEPQAIEFCAHPSAAGCIRTQTNLIPSEISMIMSNPVAFIVDVPADVNTSLGADARLVDARGSGARVPIWYYGDKSLKYVYLGEPETMFSFTSTDPGGCTRQLDFKELGKTTDEGAGKPLSNGAHLKGRIQLGIELTFLIDGDCTAELQRARDCYQSSGSCGGADPVENSARQREVQDLYNPYIQAGVITVSEIATAKTLSYYVSYE